MSYFVKKHCLCHSNTSNTSVVKAATLKRKKRAVKSADKDDAAMMKQPSTSTSSAASSASNTSTVKSISKKEAIEKTIGVCNDAVAAKASPDHNLFIDEAVDELPNSANLYSNESLSPRRPVV